MGVGEVRRVVRRKRSRSNQVSRESLVERAGGGGTTKSLSRGSRDGQSVMVPLEEGGGGEENRCESMIWKGT